MPREGGIRDDELLLLVAAGDRGVQRRADDVDALVDHRGTGGFGKEPAQGGQQHRGDLLGGAQDGAQDDGVLLDRDDPQQHVGEIRRGQGAVAQHLPQRT